MKELFIHWNENRLHRKEVGMKIVKLGYMLSLFAIILIPWKSESGSSGATRPGCCSGTQLHRL
jgi:hypothetical protein